MKRRRIKTRRRLEHLAELKRCVVSQGCWNDRHMPAAIVLYMPFRWVCQAIDRGLYEYRPEGKQ